MRLSEVTGVGVDQAQSDAIQIVVFVVAAIGCVHERGAAEAFVVARFAQHVGAICHRIGEAVLGGREMGGGAGVAAADRLEDFFDGAHLAVETLAEVVFVVVDDCVMDVSNY